MVKKTDEQRAREYGVSVSELREVEERLRAIPTEVFLESLYGLDGVVYDPDGDVWLALDRMHRGPGRGLLVIRRDKSFMRVVIEPEALN